MAKLPSITQRVSNVKQQAQKDRADDARKKLQSEQPKPNEIQQAILDNPQVTRGQGSLGKLTREEKLANLANVRLSASGTKPTGDDSKPMDRYQSSLNRTPIETQQDTFSFIQDEPPKSTGDPIEDKIQMITWQRNQALKQAQAVTEASQVARQNTENLGEDMMSQAIQQRGQALGDTDALGRPIRRDSLGQQIGGVGANGGMIQQGEMINPAYQDLTTEEKRMNMYDIDPQTGQPIRRSTPRIAPTVDYNKTIQNAKLYASPNAEKYRNKSNAEIVKMINSDDIDNLRDDVKNLKIDLGLERGQSITVNDAGEIEIMDENGEIFDPVKRAEDRYNRETAEQLEEAQENHQKNMDYIRATYTKADGTLTAQGKRMVLKTQKDYNETVNRYERDRGEQLETIIKQEKKRQQAVEALSTPRQLTLDEKIAQEERNNYVGLINDYINQSRDQFGRPTIGLAEASRMAKKAKETMGIDGVNTLKEFQGYMSSQVGQNSTPDSMFQKAYELSGNNATDAMKIIKDSFGTNIANHAMEEWEKSIGFNEESIQLNQLKRTKEEVVMGQNDESGIRLAQLFKDYNALDPTGSLSLRLAYSIKGSETTNANQRELADLQIQKAGATQRGLMPKYSSVKDRFGNPMFYDPTNPFKKLTPSSVGTGITGSMAGGQPQGQSLIPASTDPTVITWADQIARNEADIDDAKKTLSPMQMERLGPEIARKREEIKASGEATPAQIEADGYLSAFNNGTPIEKIWSTIGVNNADVKDEFNKLVKQQGGKRVFGQDSESIKDIERQITNLQGLIEDNNYERISGISRWGLMKGSEGDALAKAKAVLSSQTLNALAGAKDRGITFGALSEQEMKTVRDSASDLAALTETDEAGNITGFSGSEEGLREKITELTTSLVKSVTKKAEEDSEIEVIEISSGRKGTIPVEEFDANLYLYTK